MRNNSIKVYNFTLNVVTLNGLFPVFNVGFLLCHFFLRYKLHLLMGFRMPISVIGIPLPPTFPLLILWSMNVWKPHHQPVWIIKVKANKLGEGSTGYFMYMVFSLDLYILAILRPFKFNSRFSTMSSGKAARELNFRVVN